MVARSNPLDPFWTKFQGELHFSAMNYPAALRSYIQTMALGTNFFLKLPPFSPDQGQNLHSTVRNNAIFALPDENNCKQGKKYHRLEIGQNQ